MERGAQRGVIVLILLLSLEAGGETKASDDNNEDISWLCNKIANLRIFGDKTGVMNISLKDYGGEALVISQFTLYAQNIRSISIRIRGSESRPGSKVMIISNNQIINQAFTVL